MFVLDHTEFLSDSKFVDDVDHIATCFDKTTKPRFRNVDEPQYIKFGGARDNDEMSNIRFGQMKLPGYLTPILLRANVQLAQPSDIQDRGCKVFSTLN